MAAVEHEVPRPVRHRPLWRRLIGPLFSVALLGAVLFWFLPQFTSIADVWTSVRSMSWAQVTILVVAVVSLEHPLRPSPASTASEPTTAALTAATRGGCR